MKILLASILLVTTFSDALDVYQGGFSYSYKYEGHVTTSTKDFPAGMKLKSAVIFDFLGKSKAKVQNVIMTLKSPRFQDLRGNSLIGRDVSKWEEPIMLERLPDSRIGKVFTRPGHPTDILNIKRGIASLLQVAMATLRSREYTFTKKETDVSGTCNYTYSVHSGSIGNSARQSGGVYHVRKVNDFSTCTHRPRMAYTALEVTDCDSCDKVDAHVPKSFTETNCTVYHLPTNPFVQDCRSVEKYSISIGRNDLFVKTRRNLAFQSRKATFKLPQFLHDITADRKGLAFELEDLRHKKKNHQKLSFRKISKALKELSKKMPMDSSNPDAISFDASAQFLELVETLRWNVNKKTFHYIYRYLYHDNKYKFWLRGALPFISNNLATQVIKRKIKNKEFKGYDVIQVLSRLAVTPTPNEKMCEHVLDICDLPSVKGDRNIYSTCWLSFGSLVHNVYRKHSVYPKKFVAKLAKQYQTFGGGRDPEKFVVTLKTIGNTGMKSFFPEILKILDERDRVEPPHSNIVVVSAIDALRRMRLSHKEKKQMKDALQQVFADTKSCPETRTNAFALLMKARPSTSQLAAISRIIAREKIQHVKNYVFTYLGAMTQNSQPCPVHEARQASLLMGFLVQHGQTNFKPSFTRALHYKVEKTSPVTGFPEEFEIKKGYTHSSFIPRYLKIKYSKKLMGYKFAIHEFHLRQEGLLPFMKNMVGPHGSEQGMKSWWDIVRPKRSPKADPVAEELQRIDGKVNIASTNDKELRLSLSSKLFGSEIEYLVYDKNDKLLATLINEGNIRLDKNWLQNSLGVGMKYDKRAMDLLFDGMRMIPTSIGLPLTLKLTIGGVLNHVASCELTTKPMLSLLSFRNKPTEIKGQISLRPRAAVGTTAQMYILYGESKFGLKHQANTTLFFHLNGEIDYNLAQQKYVNTWELPGKERTFFRKSSVAQIFTETRGRPRTTKYISLPLQHTVSQSNQNSYVSKPSLTTLNSRTLGPFSLRGSSPGVFPDMSEIRVEPTAASGYGVRLELENVTSGNTEQVYRLKMSRVGTSPLDEYTAELRIVKRPLASSTSSRTRNPPVASLQNDAKLMTTEVANLTVTHSTNQWKLCLLHKKDLATKDDVMNVAWGKDCKKYQANFTIGYVTEANPSLDLSVSWNKTPLQLMKFHYMMCFLEASVSPRKQNQGILHSQGLLSNGPFPGQGTFPGQGPFLDQGPLPGRKQRPGKGPFPGQESSSAAGPSAGQGPFPGQGSSSAAGPSTGQGPFPGHGPSDGQNLLADQGSRSPSALTGACAKRIQMRITITNQSLEIRGLYNRSNVLFSFPLPKNVQSGLRHRKDLKLMMQKFVFPEFPSCKVQHSRNIFTTFDRRSFVYRMAIGCPHVLAKDTSNNNLFTILLKKNRANQQVVSVYLKRRNSGYHVFEIRNTGHVLHMRRVPRFKKVLGTNEMKVEDPDVWTLVKQPNVTRLTCNVGIDVTVSIDSVTVNVSPWHYTMVRGLCGYYNEEPGDDFHGPNGEDTEKSADPFAASWVVPGSSCKSECPLVHRPVITHAFPSGKKCVGTKPLPRCAVGCVPLRTTASVTGFHCFQDNTKLAKIVERNIAKGRFEEILKVARNKKVDMKKSVDFHTECRCDSCT